MSCKVLILTHGNLAEAFVNTSKLILGNVENMIYINMPEVFDYSQYCQEISNTIIENKDNGLLILIDILGGSPFLLCSQIIKEHFDSVELVTGCNLSMILEVGSEINNKSLEELKDIAINSGTKGIIDFKKRCTEEEK